MKRLKSLFLVIGLLLTSCGNKVHNERGYVVEKNHREPYNTIMVTTIYTGKVLIPVTYVIHHSETWSLDLRDEVEGEYKNYVVYLRDSSIWEQINVGDYFIWDEETCWDCEPTTRERA